MMRILIPFVVAFGLSLGAATGVVVMRAPTHTTAVKATAAVAKSDSSKAGDSAVASPPVPSTAVAQTNPMADTSHGLVDSAHGSLHPSATLATVAAQPIPVASVAKADPSRNATDAGGPSVRAAVLKSPPTSAPPTATRPAPPDSSVEKRLAKVFAVMQARDAARVLEQMDDNDVRVILASLSDKQQAAILGSFPTQRAASIARATLRQGAGNP